MGSSVFRHASSMFYLDPAGTPCHPVILSSCHGARACRKSSKITPKRSMTERRCCVMLPRAPQKTSKIAPKRPMTERRCSVMAPARPKIEQKRAEIRFPAERDRMTPGPSRRQSVVGTIGFQRRFCLFLLTLQMGPFRSVQSIKTEGWDLGHGRPGGGLSSCHSVILSWRSRPPKIEQNHTETAYDRRTSLGHAAPRPRKSNKNRRRRSVMAPRTPENRAKSHRNPLPGRP